MIMANPLKRSAQLTVGGSINNALCICKHGNETRILICNNDETIKIYSLPDLQRITSITFPTAVNYASVFKMILNMLG